MARRRVDVARARVVLAATADPVVAFTMTAEGYETTTTVTKIKRGERGQPMPG